MTANGARRTQLRNYIVIHINIYIIYFFSKRELYCRAGRGERSIGVHVVKTNCFIMTGAHDGDKSEDDRSCILLLQ